LLKPTQEVEGGDAYLKTLSGGPVGDNKGEDTPTDLGDEDTPTDLGDEATPKSFGVYDRDRERVVVASEKPKLDFSSGVVGFGASVDKRLNYFVERGSERDFKSPLVKNLVGVPLGLVGSVVTTREFARNIITKPKDVARSLGGAGVSLVKGEFSVPSVSNTLLTKQGFSTGFIVGEIATGVGGGFVFKETVKGGKALLTRLDPNFKPVVDVPVTKSQRVSGYERTVFKNRGKGEALPDRYVLASDEYVAVGEKVKPYTRNVPTGETKKFIKDVPTRAGTVDIELEHP